MHSFYYVSAILFACLVPSGCAHLQKRGIPLLTFPRTSPTRVQIISGIGIPVALDFESVTIGYVFKAEYFLPENASNVLDIISDPFTPTTRPLSGTGRRRRSDDGSHVDPNEYNFEAGSGSHGFDSEQQTRFEKYSVEAKVLEEGPDVKAAAKGIAFDDVEEEDYGPIPTEDDIESDARHFSLNDVKIKQPNNLATARFTLYKGMESMVAKRGLQGRPCMLRSICESAAAQFSYDNGILGELAHIIMTPSSSPDEITEHADNEYLHAEELGRSGAPCDQVFRECPVSILDNFSGMYDGLIDLFG